ncbi:unnamed protein product [Ixodes pacificus]
MHLEASHLATTEGLQRLTPCRNGTSFRHVSDLALPRGTCNKKHLKGLQIFILQGTQRQENLGKREVSAPTWHFLAVELHLDSVDSGRARHEGGQEAVSPQGLHVARHMVAVHHDLQVAGASLRPIDCKLTFEFNRAANSSVGHVADTNLGCVESVAAERTSRQGSTLDFDFNHVFANFRCDKLHLKLPRPEDVHAHGKLATVQNKKYSRHTRNGHPEVVSLKVRRADPERGRPLHRNELQRLPRYLHLGHITNSRWRHLPRFGRLPCYTLDGRSLTLPRRGRKLFNDTTLLLLQLLKMGMLKTLPPVDPVPLLRRPMGHDWWSHLPRLRTLPRRRLFRCHGVACQRCKRLNFRLPLLNINPSQLFAAFLNLEVPACWGRRGNRRCRFPRGRRRWRLGCLPRGRPVRRDYSRRRRRRDNLADCVDFRPLSSRNCDALLALPRHLGSQSRLKLGARGTAGVGVQFDGRGHPRGSVGGRKEGGRGGARHGVAYGRCDSAGKEGVARRGGLVGVFGHGDDGEGRALLTAHIDVVEGNEQFVVALPRGQEGSGVDTVTALVHADRSRVSIKLHLQLHLAPARTARVTLKRHLLAHPHHAGTAHLKGQTTHGDLGRVVHIAGEGAPLNVLPGVSHSRTDFVGHERGGEDAVTVLDGALPRLSAGRDGLDVNASCTRTVREISHQDLDERSEGARINSREEDP